MELNQISNGMKVYGADGEYFLIADEKLKFEAGEDEMSNTVPVGKKWKVTVSMKVEEEDI